jgi:acyl-[acyl-carrier-protein]-phospholipid O-acyltransferase/long-chain-fatty-acid--[acyl-carrier-protein] ligase
LSAVEEHAKKALDLEEVIAVGVSDERKGEKIIVVTLSPEASIYHLREYWKENGLNPLSLPSNVHYFSTIPLLGSGKVDRVTIRKQIEQQGKEVDKSS